mmetsp:Transcript_40767/g.95747  ORF Transcript_40767/g.95747 Transcript_40767/m.95747 type:complete len:242 (-) Transcript_40767:834-1559(-)
MVCSFLAFSFCLKSVASAMAFSKAATSAESSVMSSANLAIEASSSSISACKLSTAAVFSLRVCSLVASSVSHHPLCSASSLASSIKRTISSLIIFLTFSKGSSATRLARSERTRLFNLLARPCRKLAALLCWLLKGLPLTCTRAVVFLAMKDGKYLSALPETASLDKILMASAIASSSSVRNCCLASKSLAFCLHVAVRSARYFSSSFLVVVVSVSWPSASAFPCKAWARNSVLELLSWVA